LKGTKAGDAKPSEIIQITPGIDSQEVTLDCELQWQVIHTVIVSSGLPIDSVRTAKAWADGAGCQCTSNSLKVYPPSDNLGLSKYARGTDTKDDNCWKVKCYDGEPIQPTGVTCSDATCRMDKTDNTSVHTWEHNCAATMTVKQDTVVGTWNPMSASKEDLLWEFYKVKGQFLWKDVKPNMQKDSGAGRRLVNRMLEEEKSTFQTMFSTNKSTKDAEAAKALISKADSEDSYRTMNFKHDAELEARLGYKKKQFIDLTIGSKEVIVFDRTTKGAELDVAKPTKAA
jgi:hypothetical protein